MAATRRRKERSGATNANAAIAPPMMPPMWPPLEIPSMPNVNAKLNAMTAIRSPPTRPPRSHWTTMMAASSPKIPPLAPTVGTFGV